ncbi:MAG: biotin--[acetyl-CoA-carboxylase] ligase [Polyangiaceae bacterium]|nr:biotin--[acetyl-CoA-carboxylase] ligase [Polyangiaceae bacterium]
MTTLSRKHVRHEGGASIAPDLEHAADVLSARGGRLGARLIMVDETVSTNDDAKRGAKDGANHGTVWLAESQSGGRGRQGRRWLSARGENLLFSVLMRVACAPFRLPPVSLACGLAVRDAVAATLGDDASVLVKWPNDVLIKHPSDGRARKVSGILVESAIVGGHTQHIVVGVGINVHTRMLPEEISSIATSVAIERTARGFEGAPDRASILADVLASLDRYVEHVAHQGLGLVYDQLLRYDAMAGREVQSDAGDVRGTACGIDLDGRLLVRTAESEVVAVSAGEVRMISK